MNLDRLIALADQGRRVAGHTQKTSPASGYRIANADTERAEVFIYGAIDEWDVSAGVFVRELRDITAKNIDLHINSPGGLVFDGVAIYSALKNHDASVTSYVDGIAASAASFVAMAGDEVVMEKPAKMMIHDAQGLAIGNAADMRELADLLDQLSDTIADIYADKAGGSTETWRTAMQKTTWYSANEAVKAGLADRVANDNSKAAPEDLRSQRIRARARVALGRV